MKSFLGFFILFIGYLMLSQSLFSQCQINADFNDFQVNGMSTTIEWDTESPDKVICYSSDWQPSFFVNQDSLINVRISGTMSMSSENGDDDFVGFVFGYKSPTFGTEANDNQFLLFDWKKVGQHAPDEFGGFLAKEGYSLISTNGIISGDPITTYEYFWGHNEGDNFKMLAENYGNTLGWEYDTPYHFEVIYTDDNITIIINDEEIFNVNGCYHAGLFGLYTLNQNGVVFEDISIEQVYKMRIDSGEDDFCEDLPIQFSFLDSVCGGVPPSLLDYQWNFGDGAALSDELNPIHTFYNPGPYWVELYITNTEGCTDTIQKLVFVEPKPQIQEDPEDEVCFVGDQVEFNVGVTYAYEFQWYYKTTDMSYWSKVQNNGYFTGATTTKLKVYNVRPNFDGMKLRCEMIGKCGNIVTSQYAKIEISDIPVRAYLNATDSELCTSDSTIFTILLQEPYQIKKASLRLLYDSLDFKFTDYTTYLQNMMFNFDVAAGYVDIDIHVVDAINLDEAIVASLNFLSIGNSNSLSQFDWDEENTYFINENNDTIYQYLYGTFLKVYQPFTSGLKDSVELCRGESIQINPINFNTISWSSGETSFSIIPLVNGEYEVELTDIHGCYNKESFFVEVKDQPTQPDSIVFSKDYYCSYEDSLSFEIFGGSGDNLNIYYNNLLIVDSIFQEHTYKVENPGEDFEMKALWSNNCGLSEERIQIVDVKDEKFPSLKLSSNDQGLHLGDQVIITANIEDGGSNPYLFWYVDNQLVQMGGNTTYLSNDFGESNIIDVTMYSSAECIFGDDKSAFDQIEIHLESEKDFYIPSVVTPNGDGVDDSFKVYFTDNSLETFKLHIFDITGRLIYSTQNSHNYYDGFNTLYSGGIEVLTYMVEYQYPGESLNRVSGKFLIKK